MFFQRSDMLRQIAARQNAAMYFRVQGFNTPIQHFRKAGVIGHLGDLDAIVRQQFGGAAGGKDIDAHRGKRTCEIKHAGFVGDGNKSLFDHDEQCQR